MCELTPKWKKSLKMKTTMKIRANLRYNRKKTIPRTKPQEEMEEEITDPLQESEPEATPAIRNPPVAQAALATRTMTTAIDIIESHDKKEDDKSDS